MLKAQNYKNFIISGQNGDIRAVVTAAAITILSHIFMTNN